MAKARVVPGIRPKRSLRENAQKVISVRLDEFMGWRDALADEALVSDLHDMRIAAKRLRYALEMFDLCLDDPKSLLKELSSIQEDLGEIHDFDVLMAVLRERLAVLDAASEAEAIQIMADETETRFERSRHIRRLLSTSARNPRRVGLMGLLGGTIASRHRRYAKFQERYGETRLDVFAARVQAAYQSQLQVAGMQIDGSEREDSAERLMPITTVPST